MYTQIVTLLDTVSTRGPPLKVTVHTVTTVVQVNGDCKQHQIMSMSKQQKTDS